MARRGSTGTFIPKNPEKYLGDVNNITWRSSWELRAFQFMDGNPNVLGWASEEIPFIEGVDLKEEFTGTIIYIKPTDRRPHQYYPDIFAVMKDKAGNIGRFLIEIKPLKETGARVKKMSVEDKITVAINHAKWEAARKYCEPRGMKFVVLTERELFGRSK